MGGFDTVFRVPQLRKDKTLPVRFLGLEKRDDRKMNVLLPVFAVLLVYPWCFLVLFKHSAEAPNAVRRTWVSKKNHP